MSAGSGAVAPGGGGFGRLARILAAIITSWAILGGVVLFALALETAASAAFNVAAAAPFAFDHEVTKLAVAVAIFMFLPYCQLVGANVTVDIFTERMPARAKAAMAAFAALFAVALAALLLRQMSLGLQSYREYVEVTPVLGVPIWTAFPPILASLALLLMAGVLSLLDAVRETRGLAPLLRHEPRAEDHL